MLARLLACSTLLLVFTALPVRAQGCPSQGLIKSIGTGTPGTNGVPLLSTVGAPLEGKAFWFQVSEGLPGAAGILFGSLGEAAFPVPQFAATLYLTPPFFLQPFLLDSQGAAGDLFQQLLVPNLCGIEAVHQSVVLDPLAAGGVAFTKALRVHFAGPAAGTLFASESTYTAGSVPQSVAIDDLDGDGVADMVVTNRISDDVSVFLGLGDGTFAASQEFPAGADPWAVVIHDLDGDGQLDLAVTNEHSDEVSVLLGLGDGTFAAALSFAVGQRPRALDVGDLNGDGVPDLAVANRDTFDVSVLLGLGDGSFAAAQTFAAGSFPSSIAIGDLDGDGVPDLAVTLYGDATVAVYPGLGDGTFATPAYLSVSSRPSSVAIGDLNGDGLPDLAVSSGSDPFSIPSMDPVGTLSLLLGSGGGSFTQLPQVQFFGRPDAVMIGDLNGDGLPDVAMSINSDNFSYPYGFAIVPGLGHSTFTGAQLVAIGEKCRFAAIADLNGDGAPDLATVNIFDVSVLLGVDGGFFPGTSLQTSKSANTGSVVVEDLDGDGVLDLTMGASSPSAIMVRLGLGNGTYATPAFVPVKNNGSIVAEDLDADGVLDLVALGKNDNVVAMLGIGDGTFAAALSYPVGVSPRRVVVVDLDGDDVPDLAVVNGFDNNVSILLGLGNGTFAAAQGFSTGAFPSDLAAGDLNGDGVFDLATVNFNSNNVSVLLGLGDGTFATAVNYPAGSKPKHFAIDDLDGDGVLDMAIPSISDNQVRVLRGVGDGTFVFVQSIAGGGSPRWVSIGDLDGDGVPDLAVVNSTSFWNKVTVLLGLGDANFVFGEDTLAGVSPSSATIADLNTDGVPDLVITNSGSLVTVIMNQLLE